MSFLRNLFSKKAEEDYETILANLANDVKKRQVKLSEIRLRERRFTVLATMYTAAAWMLYISLWYIDALPANQNPKGSRHMRQEKAIKAIPVVIGPILILFIRRLVQVWYQRKGNAEEKSLQALMKVRRDKVEEIKKKTNYYSTRALLSKYDDTPSDTPIRRPFGPVKPNPFQTPKQPQFIPKPPPNGQAPAVKPPTNGQIDPRLIASPPAPVGTPRKQWYDKLADAILGDDEQSFQSPSSRFALICEKCFNHNGLVKESMWEDAQYVCPKCGHFNASVKAKKQQRQPQAATPSATPAATPTSLPLTPPGISRNSSPADLPTSSSSPAPSPSHSPEPPLAQPAFDRDTPTVDTDVTTMEVDE